MSAYCQALHSQSVHLYSIVHYFWRYHEQLGFTTEQESGRSGVYCTDIAKSADAAVIHVNGSDTDAVITAAKLAVAAWHKFGRDVW
jgi:2-oxoglutarate dehydrogenase complex dehydrogenase (E1) component-like enzyme